MDIDERLERLTLRHESLTQTVALLTRDLSDMRVLVNDITEGTARLLHGNSRKADQPIGRREIVIGEGS